MFFWGEIDGTKKNDYTHNKYNKNLWNIHISKNKQCDILYSPNNPG